MRIVPFEAQYLPDFISLNEAWMNELFGEVEETDKKAFEDAERIVREGGQIFFALNDEGKAIACCMTRPLQEGEWEICKFAAAGMGTGKGAGAQCLAACIGYAEAMGALKLCVASHTKCEKAVHLYQKFGFCIVPYSFEKFGLKRCNISLEMKI